MGESQHSRLMKKEEIFIEYNNKNQINCNKYNEWPKFLAVVDKDRVERKRKMQNHLFPHHLCKSCCMRGTSESSKARQTGSAAGSLLSEIIKQGAVHVIRVLSTGFCCLYWQAASPSFTIHSSLLLPSHPFFLALLSYVLLILGLDD